jgi:flagellar assembly protein FliH
MGTVIKAGEHGRGIPGVAFNFEDISKQADAYLAKVREQAKQIVADAMKEAAALKTKAQQEGQKAATVAAEKQVDQRLLGQLQPALTALQNAAKEISASRQAWVTNWERSAVSLSCAIAARVLRREVEKEPRVTLKLVREALDLASGQSNVRLRMSAKDHAALGPHVKEIAASLGGLGNVELIADSTLTPGGCRVETDLGVIDQTFDAQLERIAGELT